MFSRNQFRYFLIVVDCYSNRMYTKALKNKTSKTVAQALKTIFDQFQAPIEKFETDRSISIAFIYFLLRLLLQLNRYFGNGVS